MKEVYLDNAAGTPLDRRVAVVMEKAMRECGNPSAFNDAGRRARSMLEAARTKVARFLHARGGEVIFCSSGSEANNLAIMGIAATARNRHHIITTTVEHRSVLEPVKALAEKGWRVSCIPVDEFGSVKAEDISHSLNAKTALVSVMYANNEVGTIQPIQKIAKAIQAWRKAHRTVYPYFHVDACQATSWLSMDVQALGVDVLTLNGSKVHGPRGSAALFVRRGIEVDPQILGGSQEQGLRAGTEDVPAVAGLAKALGLVRSSDRARVVRLRDYAIAKLAKAIPDVRFHGAMGEQRLPNSISVSIPGCTSEELLLELDRYGIRAGSGSACTAHSVEPSHVLRAMNVPRRFLDGALRFSMSRQTTKTEIDRLIATLPRVVDGVRRRRLK